MWFTMRIVAIHCRIIRHDTTLVLPRSASLYSKVVMTWSCQSSVSRCSKHQQTISQHCCPPFDSAFALGDCCRCVDKTFLVHQLMGRATSGPPMFRLFATSSAGRPCRMTCETYAAGHSHGTCAEASLHLHELCRCIYAG